MGTIPGKESVDVADEWPAPCLSLLTPTRHMLMHTGIPGNPIDFGMAEYEAWQAAGSPDCTYQDVFLYGH